MGFNAFEMESWHHYLTDRNRFELQEIEFNKLKNEL